MKKFSGIDLMKCNWINTLACLFGPTLVVYLFGLLGSVGGVLSLILELFVALIFAIAMANSVTKEDYKKLLDRVDWKHYIINTLIMFGIGILVGFVIVFLATVLVIGAAGGAAIGLAGGSAAGVLGFFTAILGIFPLFYLGLGYALYFQAEYSISSVVDSKIRKGWAKDFYEDNKIFVIAMIVGFILSVVPAFAFLLVIIFPVFSIWMIIVLFNSYAAALRARELTPYQEIQE